MPSGKKPEQCDCERGPVAFYVSITKAGGELMDRVGLCDNCVTDRIVRQALDALGLTLGGK